MEAINWGHILSAAAILVQIAGVIGQLVLVRRWWTLRRDVRTTNEETSRMLDTARLRMIAVIGRDPLPDKPVSNADRLFTQWRCPNCHEFANWRNGARAADMSVNIECAKCGSRYNVTPVLQHIEEIS